MIEGVSSFESTKRGPLVAEGKTKQIFEVPGNPDMAIVAYKNDITAFDDPSFTKQFEKKAEHSNTTNAAVFEMLNNAGIPTAFVKKLSATEFLSKRCTMIPLEVVGRRYATGSYLKRHPEFEKQPDDVPHRFEHITPEFFLKTTKGSLKDRTGSVIVDGLDPKAGEEDPFIQDPFAPTWNLLHPKKTAGEALLGKTLDATKVATPEQMQKMQELVVRAFEVLENFFAQHNFKFVDYKIEFGITPEGELVIADVIDNDSWRLRDQNWNDVSKQSFRDGEDMSTVANKYELVARLLEKGSL